MNNNTFDNYNWPGASPGSKILVCSKKALLWNLVIQLFFCVPMSTIPLYLKNLSDLKFGDSLLHVVKTEI